MAKQRFTFNTRFPSRERSDGAYQSIVDDKRKQLG
jgi:hypothetical protein